MASYNFNTSSSNISNSATQRSLLSKTFTYMMLFLLITVAVSVVISLIMQNCGLSTTGEVISEGVINAYLIMLIVASISQIVLTIVIVFTSLRQGKTAMIPMILYAMCMGVLISSFSIYLDWYVIASAFAIAALSFGGMALIGMRSKNASGLGMVGFGLLFGVLMVSLFSIILFFLAPTAYIVWDIVSSVIIVIAIMLITAFDVYNIRRISQAGNNASNLALYLAFNLYVDFIVVFIYILRLLAIFGVNRR